MLLRTTILSAACAAAWMFAPPEAAAALGVPYLVKDINPGSASSSPQKLLAVGSRLFFAGTDGTTGFEPMASDGTALHTILLKDVTPGPLGGILGGCPTCNAVTTGNTVYFSASDGAAANLWRTDGTPGGTVKVYPGTSAGALVAVGGQVYFAGSPVGFSIAFLFKSDGTTAGTAQVSNTTYLTGYGTYAFAGAAYFPADDNSTGTELWRSDGTSLGTTVVSNIAPGNSSSNPALLTKVGTQLFFVANNGVGPGLYRTDGTTLGTAALKQMQVGDPFVDHGQIADLNGTAIFLGNDGTNGLELWRSDGSPGGTKLVKDIYPGSASGMQGAALVVMGNAVYFAADDSVHGRELWRSDGTAAGTVLVKDIYPTFGEFGSSSPTELTNIRGTLFFTATSGGVSGSQPWVSDGTEVGTVQLGVVYPGGASQAASYTEVNGTVYFSASDGVHGIELWAVANPTTAVGPPAGAEPGAITLAQARPNPARQSTRISYALASPQRVKLVLFDLFGRAVRTLEDRDLAAGSYDVDLDGSQLPSGVYLYRLETATGSLQHKVFLTH